MFPDLQMESSRHYLVRANGEHSTDSYRAQQVLLGQVLALLDAQAVRAEDQEAMDRLVEVNTANIAQLAAELPALTVTEAAKRRYVPLVVRNEPAFEEILKEISGKLFAAAEKTDESVKRGEDEIAYLYVKVDSAVHMSLADSIAEVLPQLKAMWAELCFTTEVADPSVSNSAWVGQTLAECDHPGQ